MEEENLKISIREMLDNPTGKGSSFFAKRKTIKQALSIEFIKLLREHRKEFYAIPYLFPSGDILFHVKVPSEFFKKNKISYDVLFLIKNNKQQRLALRDCIFFSNSPSFLFTYAYVFNKKGILIDFLKSILPNECLTTPPLEKNPVESLGYEKSITMAAHYLISGFCLTDSYIQKFKKSGSDLEIKFLIKKIADPEILLTVYQHAAYKARKTHRKHLHKSTEKKRERISSEYFQTRKTALPKKHSIFSSSPRSKITARKAKKSLLNN